MNESRGESARHSGFQRSLKAIGTSPGSKYWRSNMDRANATPSDAWQSSADRAQMISSSSCSGTLSASRRTGSWRAGLDGSDRVSARLDGSERVSAMIAD